MAAAAPRAIFSTRISTTSGSRARSISPPRSGRNGRDVTLERSGKLHLSPAGRVRPRSGRVKGYDTSENLGRSRLTPTLSAPGRGRPALTAAREPDSRDLVQPAQVFYLKQRMDPSWRRQAPNNQERR